MILFVLTLVFSNMNLVDMRALIHKKQFETDYYEYIDLKPKNKKSYKNVQFAMTEFELFEEIKKAKKHVDNHHEKENFDGQRLANGIENYLKGKFEMLEHKIVVCSEPHFRYALHNELDALRKTANYIGRKKKTKKSDFGLYDEAYHVDGKDTQSVYLVMKESDSNFFGKVTDSNIKDFDETIVINMWAVLNSVEDPVIHNSLGFAESYFSEGGEYVQNVFYTPKMAIGELYVFNSLRQFHGSISPLLTNTKENPFEERNRNSVEVRCLVKK